MTSNRRVVLCTCPPDDAPRLARALVEARLAACVNVTAPVTSHYRWQGELCVDPEALLIIKTTASGVERLTKALVELHPYDLPEVIALPITGGSAPYLEWLGAQVSVW